MSKIIVLDNGSCTIKIGFAGEDSPRYIFPNCIAKVRKKEKVYYCDQIYTITDYFCYLPFKEGLLVDFSLQVDIWTYIFEKLNIVPSLFDILITEQFINPTTLRHCIPEVMFNHFGFKNIIISSSPQLVPFAYSPIPPPDIVEEHNPSYLVLDCGFQCCHSVPMFQGQPIYQAYRRMDVGGYHLDLVLKNILAYKQVDLSQNALLVSKIKELGCYLSLNFLADMDLIHSNKTKQENNNNIECSIVFPDYSGPKSNIIKFFKNNESLVTNFNSKVNDLEKLNISNSTCESDIGSINKNKALKTNQVQLKTERIYIPEVLFRPSDANFDSAGIAELLITSILASPIELQQLLAANILLAGGSTKFKNFKERLENELKERFPSKWVINVRALGEKPEYAAWIGGSIWASSSNLYDYSINKVEFNRKSKV